MLLIYCYFIFNIFTAMAAMPLPFYRELSLQSPPLSGDDVKIAQTLLNRNNAVIPKIFVNGVFDEASSAATKQFQDVVGLKATGAVDDTTAQKLLEFHSADGVKDTGFTAASKGYLYKLYVPVHNNRSIETTAILFDKDNNELLQFTVRTHGHREDGTAAAWPDFGNGDFGLNEFTEDGMSVTGVIELDLNSPEVFYFFRICRADTANISPPIFSQAQICMVLGQSIDLFVGSKETPSCWFQISATEFCSTLATGPRHRSHGTMIRKCRIHLDVSTRIRMTQKMSTKSSSAWE